MRHDATHGCGRRGACSHGLEWEETERCLQGEGAGAEGESGAAPIHPHTREALWSTLLVFQYDIAICVVIPQTR